MPPMLLRKSESEEQSGAWPPLYEEQEQKQVGG